MKVVDRAGSDGPSLTRSPTFTRMLVALGLLMLWSPSDAWPWSDDGSVWGCLGFLVRSLERINFHADPAPVLRLLPARLVYTLAITFGLVVAGEVRIAVLQGRLESGPWLFQPLAWGGLSLIMIVALWSHQSVIESTLMVDGREYPRVETSTGVFRYHAIFRVYESERRGGRDVAPVVDSDVAHSMILISALGSGVLGAMVLATLGARPPYRRKHRFVGYASPTRS